MLPAVQVIFTKKCYACQNYGSLLQNIVSFIGLFCKGNFFQVIFTKKCYASTYGVATISRLLKIIVLFCRISSLL